MKPSTAGLHRTSMILPSAGAIASLRLPHLIAVGQHPGPTSAVVAGQHGREVAGILAAASAFAELDPAGLHGTVHFLPIVNPLALQIRQQDFPFEASRYRKLNFRGTSNLDRLWKDGEASESLDPLLNAITTHVWDALLSHCDQLLDLHSWSEFFCPMAWAGESDRSLLQQTGYPFLTVRPQTADTNLGTLRERAWKTNKPVVVVELPGQNTASDHAMELGKQTIKNFLVSCGHLVCAAHFAQRQIFLDPATSQSVIELDTSGLWLPACKPGEIVTAGDFLGEVLDTQTLAPASRVVADADGLLLFNGPPIWGEDHRESPLVYAGQTIAKIGAIASVLEHRA